MVSWCQLSVWMYFRTKIERLCDQAQIPSICSLLKATRTIPPTTPNTMAPHHIFKETYVRPHGVPLDDDVVVVRTKEISLFEEPPTCTQRFDEVPIPVSPRQRRVTFYTGKTEIIEPVRDFNLNEKEDAKSCTVSSVWWSHADLFLIQQRAKTTSRVLRHVANNRMQDGPLILAHHKTTLILASDFRSLVKLPLSSPDQDLVEWCSRDDGRRGLERFVSKTYGCFRSHDVTKTRTVVIREQVRQKCAGINDPEAIAEMARNASLRARSFAMFFGGADASQAKDETKAPPVEEHVKQSVARPRKRSKIQ
jgi:hypothetical protein